MEELEKDVIQAVASYQCVTVENGNVGAMNNLGVVLAEGVESAENINRAIEPHERAIAEGRHAYAMNDLPNSVESIAQDVNWVTVFHEHALAESTSRISCSWISYPAH